MDVAEMTLDAYLDEWLALLRMRVQPTSFKGYDDIRNRTAFTRWQTSSASTRARSPPRWATPRIAANEAAMAEAQRAHGARQRLLESA